jgi:hypothetical protein
MKISCTGRAPSFGITRNSFMVSPQERHTSDGVLFGTGGDRSIAGVEGMQFVMCDSTETGGSATELSATDAWHEAAVGDEAYVRLIGTVARSNFRQKGSELGRCD